MPTRAALLRYVRLGVVGWAMVSAGIAAASWLALLSPALDLLNHIAPLWLLLALAGLVTAQFAPVEGRERIGVCVAFALAALAHAALIAPEWLRSAPETHAEDGPRMRIVWLNTQSGSAPEGVSDYLLNSGADFLLLAEYHPEGNTIPANLAAAYPHFAACLEPHDCNVAILSRHPPQAQRDTYAASQAGLRMAWADFEIDGAPLRLIGVHMYRPYPAQRYIAQRDELLSFVAESNSANTIMAGDFNAAPWSFVLRAIDQNGGLTRHDRAMLTWPAAPWTRLRLPAPEAFMPLDHVYSGDNWRLVSIRRGPRTGADHYPIEAEFVWIGAP
jgi:endonuclease/exonuclease/phosphatase (EEP) superfamily protein YafD